MPGGINKKHRPGELDCIWFDALPQRCKEIFFFFLEESALGHRKRDDVGVFVLIWGFFIQEDCQSPIEKILAFAFKLIAYENECDTAPTLYIDSQKRIVANGKVYYADFVLNYEDDNGTGYTFVPKNPFKLIIECDGHDYHEKTKEQVRHNNERDYDLKMAGYDVLHYSGSQIFNDPLKCAQEIYDYATMKSGGWISTPWEEKDGEI